MVRATLLHLIPSGDHEVTMSPSRIDSMGTFPTFAITLVPDTKHSSTQTNPKWSLGNRLTLFWWRLWTEATTTSAVSDAWSVPFSICTLHGASPHSSMMESLAWWMSSSRWAMTRHLTPMEIHLSMIAEAQIVFPDPVHM